MAPVTETAVKNSTGDPWRILLIELINLLGIVFTHSRHARGARATAVIFDQIIRRLDILDKMPNHTGAMIVRRIDTGALGTKDKPDYYLTFGHQAFCRANAMIRAGQPPKTPHHLNTALDQAFESFHEQGIVSLFLQLPGASSQKVDQLRFSLNLLARFRQAAENNATITFRYFGRAIAVPLISDIHGRPDPNLTLVAGLNGLSAVNMREIVKQAVSFCKLAETEEKQDCVSDNYSKIFSVRSLRTQLIQPPVEINTLLMIRPEALPEEAKASPPAKQTLNSGTVGRSGNGIEAAQPSETSSVCLPAVAGDTIDLTALASGLNLDSSDRALLAALLLFPNHGLDAETLAKHLVLANRLLHAVDPANTTAAKTEPLLNFLNDRLEQLPVNVLIPIEVQRQGVKIELHGRKIIVGLVHPRLIQRITLVKERQITRLKIDACGQWAQDPFDPKNKGRTELSALYGTAADKVIAQLADSFDGQGVRHFSRLLGSLEGFGASDQIAFELLWGLLRNAPQGAPREPFHAALPLIAKQVKDAAAAVSFLLADLFPIALQVADSDRNAFALATLLLRTHHKERDIDITHTPEEVLAVRKSLNRDTVEQAAWRLDIDRRRVLLKFQMIRDALRDASVGDTVTEVAGSDGSNVDTLLALEREGLIFLALVGGATALCVFRDALAFYCNPQADIYRQSSRHRYMHAVMAHLRIVLRGMARLGTPQDLDSLKMLEQSAARLMALDTDPAYARRVKQTMQWIAPAIRAIQVQMH
jgi:hypothetical protein